MHIKYGHTKQKYLKKKGPYIQIPRMVDDNLAISKCGTSSVRKNAVINSFMKRKDSPCQKKKVWYFILVKKTNV